MTELSVLDLSVKTFNAMNRLGLKSVEDVVSELKTIHASNAYRRDVEDGLCRYFGGGRFELGKWYDGDECGDGELLTYDDLAEMAGRPVLRESGDNYQCVLVLGVGGTEDEPRIVFSDGGRMMLNTAKKFLTAAESGYWSIGCALPAVQVSKEENRMNEITDAVRAKDLDRRIKVSAQLAQQSLYDMCTAIKEMRDSKLYKELGYSEFNDYCTKELDISDRQAYKCITIIENLPNDLVNSSSLNLGVTKLYLLAQLDEPTRAEIIENTDLENTTVRELKGRIKALEQQAEAAEEKADKLTKSENKAWGEVSKLQTDSEMQKDRIILLERQIKELESRPIEVIANDSDEVRRLKLAMEKLNADIAKEDARKDMEDKQFRDQLREEYEAALHKAQVEHEEELQGLRESLAQAKANSAAPAEDKEKQDFKALLTNAVDSIKRLTAFVQEHDNEEYRSRLEQLAKMIGG